jgi:microcystin-dependent protein
MWATEVVGVPSGWLKMDGGEYDQTAYPLLYGTLGNTYNDGSETPGYFRVPDMRDRSPRGYTSGGYIGWAPSGPGDTAQEMGLEYGTDINNLSANNLPLHNHGLSSVRTDSEPDHTHPVSWSSGSPQEDTGSNEPDRGNNGSAAKDGGKTELTIGGAGGHDHGLVGNTDNNVSPVYPVNNISPVFLLDFIMKAD